MTKHVPAPVGDTRTIASVIAEARQSLASAETYGQVLEARETARRAKEATKSAERLARAQHAHADLTAEIKKLRGEAVSIQMLADGRLADEVDAAQGRRELQPFGGQGKRGFPQEKTPPTQKEAGIDSKTLHNARAIRDAIGGRPEVINEVIDDMIAEGKPITETAVLREINDRAGMTKTENATRNNEALAMLARLDKKAGLFEGTLVDIERDGLLDLDPRELLVTMPDFMVKNVRRLAPLIVAWLQKLEQ